MPAPKVQEWIETVLGPTEFVSQYAHDHGYSQLWRLRAGSDYVWLKMHKYPRKWGCEVHALTHWGPSVGRTPSVIAYRDDPMAVLLSEVPGYAAESLTLDSESEEQMWRQAGGWLSQLHAKENDWFGDPNPDGSCHGEPSFDPVSVIQIAIESWLRQGCDMALFSDEEVTFIERGIREWCPSFAGEKPCATHRDFTPRNWMAEDTGNLIAVIDFEHARWDIRANDLVRPIDHEFLLNPRLKEAFYESYGQPSERLVAQMKAAQLRMAVSTIGWGVKFNDLPFSQRYREALHRMMEG